MSWLLFRNRSVVLARGEVEFTNSKKKPGRYFIERERESCLSLEDSCLCVNRDALCMNAIKTKALERQMDNSHLQ